MGTDSEFKTAIDQDKRQKYLRLRKQTIVGDEVTEHSSAGAKPRHVSTAVRFALAGVCCIAFLIFVAVLVAQTSAHPLTALRDVASTFWGVCINFAVCLGAVAYVSYRLQGPRAARKEAKE